MITKALFDRYAGDFQAFVDDLIVDVNGIARRLGDVLDEWQRTDFASLAPALRLCNGRQTTPAKNRAYFERPRGHSKTTDLAVVSVWSLAFSTRPLKGYCFAADKDQAGLLKQAIATLLRLNPWLAEILCVESNRVVNKAAGHPGEGGFLTIEASDVSSSYGILPDLIIADELTHWEGDGSLWHSLISSAAKRSNCLLVVISNAGFADSWQWQVREAARTDDGWIFSRLDGPKASWMTPDRLAEQRKMLPAVAYARLWLNLWTTGGGDALTPEDIAAAFRDDLEPMTGKERHFEFIAGVDLGLTRDCSAVVVLGIGRFGSPEQGKIRLADDRLWQPVPGRKVDLMEVEKHILSLDRKFNLKAVAFDPWQAELLGQRLDFMANNRRRKNVEQHGARDHAAWAQPIQPTAQNLRSIATLTIESFQDRRLQLFPCEPLRRDLLKLRVEEKSYGIRLVSPRDGDGHGDTFSAFSLALFVGHEQAGKRKARVGTFQNLDPFADAMRARRMWSQGIHPGNGSEIF